MRHPPYHLRPNKAVDRLTLVDVLRLLGPNYEQFTYYSLAGPFLEDLRVMDYFFPSMGLVSLESNEQTFQRQNFHLFNSRIKLLQTPLGNFLSDDYEPGVKDVFWLDYTDLKYARFEEFQVVLKKVPAGSVVRITLRAEPELDLASLRGRLPDEAINQVRSELEKTFEDEFYKVLPHPSSGAFATSKDFARMVQLMIRRAASTALDTNGSRRDFLPIQATRYKDQTQMLSLTGIVCQRDEITRTREQLKSVRFTCFDWEEPTEINIPALSVKERLLLERLLPISSDKDAGDILLRELKYKIENGEKASKQQLSCYADFHREYPNFVRVSL